MANQNYTIMLITLTEIIAKGKGESSLQLLIDRFAPLYDPNPESYIQLQYLRKISGRIGAAAL